MPGSKRAGGRSLARRNQAGKRVGGFLYVHKDALPCVTEEVRQAIARAEAMAGEFDWNVAKVSRERQSLLLYENFSASAFPALLKALSFDEEGRSRVIDYSGRDNPPILHRKETLLSPDDPRQPVFAAITRRVEELGLFKNRNRIGTQKVWVALLEAAGLRVEGPRLVAIGDATVEVVREKTAISRNGLSQPVSLMVRLGMLRTDFELFDYGCGRGDDVAILQANGYAAFGWDPNHRPNGERRNADVVNLGFVINVIEDPHEREESLRAAWGYARKGMAVSAMVPGKYNVEGHIPVSDGFLSSRQTFQKYFSQDELTSLVQKVTGERPIPLAPGIVAVFRDKELEQQVSFRRRSRSMVYSRISVPERETVRVQKPRASPISEKIREELEVIWRTALQLGRLPLEDEIKVDVREALQAKNVSVSRAIAVCAQEVSDSGQIRAAAQARREDLIVHFALSLFPGAVRYKTLPLSIQRDVRTLFGSHSAVIEAARQELLSLRNPGRLVEAFAQAASEGQASLEDGVLRFAFDRLAKMPVPVRIVVGCAEIVHDGVSASDLVEMTAQPVIVTVLCCDDLDSTFPKVRTRLEVDLTRQKYKIFTYSDHVLYLRSRFLEVTDPSYAAQFNAERTLQTLGIVDDRGRGPKASELATRMAKLNCKPTDR